ncbi:MAG TPA: PEP-CTERM sorting domain-containing protein, partial [Phycisphaerae bacterium]|nr:PEP-CTERM sorting domain-containing protein [Phycisphaerae bacterium]
AVQSQRSAKIDPTPANPSFPGWSGSTNLFGAGFASFGTLSGSISAAATSTPSVYGVARTIGNVELTFSDLAGVFSTTGQPVGTPVTLDVASQLDSLVTFITNSNANKSDNLAYVELTSDVFDEQTGQHAQFTIRNSTFTGFTSTPSHVALAAFVGDTLDISGRLTFHIEAKVGGFQDGPTDAALTVDAAHTAHVFIDAPANFSVVAGSAHNYSISAVPEPTSLALLAGGTMLLLGRRRARMVNFLLRNPRPA